VPVGRFAVIEYRNSRRLNEPSNLADLWIFRDRAGRIVRVVAFDARERTQMPKYRVTVRHTSVEIVEADNPYQAAVVASGRYGDGIEIADARPAVGRIPATAHKAAAKTAKKVTKKAVKKRRRLSPEARAKLAQNLVKARAARARNLRAAKKSTRAAKKSVKKAVKRR
jgi:hypothetical protein